MVKVLDAIMGSGKTSAAITYINEHPEKHFLYITPYLDETERIRDCCPDARFMLPQKARDGRYLSKTGDTFDLINQQRNIASTHKAIEYYTSEIFEALRNNHYCVIIDEMINLLEKDPEIRSDDIQMAVDGGYIYESAPGVYKLTGKEYDGSTYKVAFRLMQSRSLVQLSDKKKGTWYWSFQVDFFEVSDEIYLLTYLFDKSEMQQYFNINGIEYSYIGVSKSEDGVYRFSPEVDYIPEYVSKLGEMIHIWDNKKHNSIGDEDNSLSMNWYHKEINEGKVERLRKNIQNYFRNIHGNVGADKRMCGTFSDSWGKIRSAGYASEQKNKVPFNQRSSNKWSGCTILAYPVNVIPNPKQGEYYKKLGGRFDKDWYALSIMIQWIWRSAIRNGEEIWLYLPSKRMRTLLSDWIDNVSKGGEAVG